MHPAFFYRPGDRLSLPELNSARLDGLVIEVGEGFMPVDTVEAAEARAMSIAELVPAHMAACGPTAAWIHGAGDRPPGIHHVRRTKPTRMRASVSQRVVYHERRAVADDVQVIGGVSVTTVSATALELLFAAALAEVDDPWLRALLLVRPALIGELSDELDRAVRRPGLRRARRIVAAFVEEAGAAAGDLRTS
ncbi:hypothetical protein [Microbacterium suwonense]|uniref:AbiEi antitoxin C-terminal domain-containing protein n=1 Tax=Microbacterium suwonense TaxID=683047 RepID=A0ABN6X296_9MICO|nr:hypothetical protein [Microbacterium suwonense]BDZ38243.1 hypothetical protein GCM10025863_08570 [Microbacterium suwonense]